MLGEFDRKSEFSDPAHCPLDVVFDVGECDHRRFPAHIENHVARSQIPALRPPDTARCDEVYSISYAMPWPVSMAEANYVARSCAGVLGHFHQERVGTILRDIHRLLTGVA